MLSVALQYGAAMVPQKALAISGAVFTSNSDGTGIDLNIYDSKGAVYLTGGPCQGGSHLEDGTYYYQVTSPNGALLSSDAIGERFITVDGGFIVSSSGHVTNDVACTTDPAITVQLLPYDNTPNPGGEYKLTVGLASDVEDCDAFEDEGFNFVKDCQQIETKSDNFKVGPNGDLRIEKSISGGPGEVEGSFDITVDCGNDGTFHVTVEVPDPGFVVIHDLPEGAECEVDEDIIQEDPPLGFFWGPPTIVGSPATIEAGETVTIDVTNNLEPKSGSLKITKVIPDAPEGFEGSFDVHVTCTLGGPFDRTIDFPDPGFVTIDDIPSGAVCVVIEIPPTNPPAGFQWAGSLVSDPVMILTGQTVEVTVTNLLIEQQAVPTLTIEKTNDAPGVGEEPLADGDTVVYKLDYTLTNGPADLGVIEDVLPTGVTYVVGSAEAGDNAEFVFDGYDSATRTLRWEATQVTASGSVTYEVTVDEGAAELPQPLTNTACIDSADTEEDCAESDIFVGEPPEAETAPPGETAPPTDIAGAGDTGAPGGSLLLILLALAGVILAAVFVAPTPASIRKRMR